MKFDRCFGCMEEIHGYPCPVCGFDPARPDVVSVRSMDMESGLRSAEASLASADAFRCFPRLRDFAHGLKLHVLPVPGAFFPNVGLRSSVGRPGLEVR